MFNFSARQLSNTLANFLYPCQPWPCPSNWPEHWQPPVNPPPYDHNLFCSLVLKHESRSPEFVWGFQFSLPGSKIHHLGQEKPNSLRGPIQAVSIHYLVQIHNLGQNKYIQCSSNDSTVFISVLSCSCKEFHIVYNWFQFE